MNERELRLECLKLGGGPRQAEEAYAWVTRKAVVVAVEDERKPCAALARSTKASDPWDVGEAIAKAIEEGP